MFQYYFQFMSNNHKESDCNIIFKLYNKIEKLPKDNNKENLINILANFFVKNDLIIFDLIFEKHILFLVIKICEAYEKSLFLKILLPLLEKLKSCKFENKLKKATKKIQENKEKILNSCYNQTKNCINKGLDIKNSDMLENNRNLNNSVIDAYTNIFSASLKILFGMDIKNDLNEKKIFIKESINTLFESFFNLSKLQEDSYKDIFSCKENVNSLNYTKDLYQILNIIIYSIQFEKITNNNKKSNTIYMTSLKEIETLLNDTFIKLIINNTLSQNYFWLLYERKQNSCKEEYNVTLLKGKKVDKEKLSFNAFEVIEKKGENDLINICQNLLTNEKIVILKMNKEENKGQLTINEIREEINKEINKFYFFYTKIEKEINFFEKSIINL